MLNEIPGYAAVMLWMQKYFDCGCSAYYNHVDNMTGFKWYRNHDEAYHTHTMQAMAAEQGWGPQVGKLVKIGFYLGYLTERVVTLTELVKTGEKPHWKHETQSEYFRKIGLVDIDSMRSTYHMSFYDLHSSNVGFKLDDYNKGVILDFGGVRYNLESKLRPVYEERLKEVKANCKLLVASA